MDAISTEKASEFILSCMNFDGGFGSRPGSETHSGQVGKNYHSSKFKVEGLEDHLTLLNSMSLPTKLEIGIFWIFPRFHCIGEFQYMGYG